jgi:hypothetical protein
VDRSAAYFARYVAKNVVAAELAARCEVQVAYAIGVADPVSVLVDTFGTGAVPDQKIGALVRELFDFKPASLICTLGLKRPIYQRTAAYGHFGRVPDGPHFTWERTDRVDDLRSWTRQAFVAHAPGRSLGQRLVHQLDADRPLADGRGHPLDAAGADVADHEHARHTGLEQVGRAL